MFLPSSNKAIVNDNNIEEIIPILNQSAIFVGNVVALLDILPVGLCLPPVWVVGSSLPLQ